MGKTLNLLGCALLTILVLQISAGSAAGDPLQFVPADTEVVLSLNVRQVVDSPLFQQILDERGGRKARARLRVFRNLTGVDLLKDLDRAYLWCRVNDDDSVVLLFEGRFDQEALTDLLMANEEYRTQVYLGHTLHEWFDKKEERMKYGTFLSDGSVLIANHLPALKNALSVSRDGTGLLSSAKADFLPVGRDTAAFWGVVFNPGRSIPGRAFKGSMSAECASASVTLGEQVLVLRMDVKADSPEAAQDWHDLVRGLVAFLHLQEERSELQRLAESAKVSLVPEQETVGVEASLPIDEFIRLLPKKEPGDESGSLKKSDE